MGVDDSAENIGIEGENTDDSELYEDLSNIHAAVLARTAEIEFETNRYKQCEKPPTKWM